MLRDARPGELPVIKVSRIDRVVGNSSSAGNQIKWNKNGIWVKRNLLGYENVAEVVVSHFLSFTSLQESEYVKYYGCVIEEDGVILGNGCYSYDYIKSYGYEEITVASILEDNLESFSIEYEDLRMLLYDYLCEDPKRYLDKILCVDSIIRNCDRHFNNISLLTKEGKYFVSPLFDHGDSCLSDLTTYPLSVDFAEAFNATRVAAKPFKCNFLNNLVDNELLTVDYDGYLSSINVSRPYTLRAVKTIIEGLKETEGKAWKRL